MASDNMVDQINNRVAITYCQCGGSAVLIDFGLEYPNEPIEYQVVCCNGLHTGSLLKPTAEEAMASWEKGERING